MTERSVTHATFVLERTYDAAPAQCSAPGADPAAKARWFAGSEEAGTVEFELDFRIGGREVNRGGPPGGPVYTFRGALLDALGAELRREAASA